MKINLLAILSILFMISCKDTQYIRKKVSNGDITVKWYFYSYTTTNSNEIVDLQKGDSIITIFKTSVSPYDIQLKGKDIIVFCNNKPENEGIVSEAIEYKIIVDTSGSEFKGWDKIPKGKKEY